MAEDKKTFRSLEEAFEGLEPQQQAHCRRVSRYAEIIFTYAETHDIYVNTPRGGKELVEENIPLMAAAGKYHNIAKAVNKDTSFIQHAHDSASLFEELCAGDKSYKAAGRKLVAAAILEQDEHMDGSGHPGKKTGEEISCMARVLALANDLDELAMKLVSEHPIEDAMKLMKKKVPSQYDPEFYRAMRSCKGKLVRVFAQDKEASQAVPVAEPIIKRRVTRPMELVYRPVCNPAGEIYAREASMRFRNVKDNTLTYEEVKHIITKQGIGIDICEYFLYELCDTIRRFAACRISDAWIGIELLPIFYNKKKLADQLRTILEAEGVDPAGFRLFVPADLLKNPTKALQENLAECSKAGILFVPTGVTREFLEEQQAIFEEYSFPAVRFTSECLMDHTLPESVAYIHLRENGVEILTDGVENTGVCEMVLENGAVGYTGIFAGIYEQEEEIVKRALRLSAENIR